MYTIADLKKYLDQYDDSLPIVIIEATQEALL